MSEENYCQGCTTCCAWHHEDEAQPVLEPEEMSIYKTRKDKPELLATKENGDCHYLGPHGCTIHDTRPISCRQFDCRELLTEVMKDKRNVYMRVLMEAVRLKLEEIPKIIV